MIEINNDRIQRAITGGVYWLGLLFAAMIPVRMQLMAPIWALLGLLIPAVAARLWGERSRPKLNGFWFTGGLLMWGGSLLVSGGMDTGINLYFTASFILGFFLVHDLPVTPTLALTLGFTATLFHFERGFEWLQLEEGRVWFVAMASLLIVSAALLERDRLGRRQGLVTSPMWMLVRIGFISLFTIFGILTRKSLDVASLFESVLDIRLSSGGGKLALVGIIAASMVVATLILRSGKKRSPPGDPSRNV